MDWLVDALLDTLKLLPYLMVAFLLLEFIEHKLSKKNEKLLAKNKKYGPIVGGILGAVPQCGFSSMAANLFSGKVITVGTLIAVFLSTSDEMLPIMIGEHVNILALLRIIGFKVLIGISVGLIVDIFWKRKNKGASSDISKMCEDDHCSCHEYGIFLSSLIHTLKIGLFILIANILINFILFKVGEDAISNAFLGKSIFTYFGASLVGLIPNCASSVIITKLYLANFITIGNLISGLLTGSGIGILLLFKSNKNIKENITILSIIYFVGVAIGIIIDLFL